MSGKNLSSGAKKEVAPCASRAEFKGDTRLLLENQLLDLGLDISCLWKVMKRVSALIFSCQFSSMKGLYSWTTISLLKSVYLDSW